MALPTDSRQINNIVTTTLDAKRPRLIDNFFTSNPLFVRLRDRENIRVEGGEQIDTPIIYGGLGGGSYGKGDTFDTSFTEFMTDIRLDWKQNYAPMAMDGLEAAKNRGAARIIDYTDAMMQAARMTLADNVGDQLYTTGTGNQSKDITGLKAVIDVNGGTVTTYGGITRAATGVGNAVNAGSVNTTGGAFSLSMVNTEFGNVTIGMEKPDLIVTTQTIWNKFWERSQPSERNQAGDMREIGMESVRFNGADVVVDNHCPSGEIYVLNTKYLEFWILSGNDFRFRGPFDLSNQDAWVGQIVLYANLVCTSPRLQARIESVT